MIQSNINKMKKYILLFTFGLISLLTQGQEDYHKWNTDVIDFTADKSGFKNIDLLTQLKDEFASQFSSKYNYSYCLLPNQNDLEKLKSEGYDKIKVGKNTDLAILGELITNENALPIGIKLTFLIITDDYKVMKSHLENFYDKSIEDLAIPTGDKIKKAVTKTINNLKIKSTFTNIIDKEIKKKKIDHN